MELASDEIRMLVLGLTDWGGPAQATDQLAVQIGFSDANDLEGIGERLAAEIAGRRPLSARDWTRALMATEAAYAQEGDEWTTNQGSTPEYWTSVLRQLQSKLPTVPTSS